MTAITVTKTVTTTYTMPDDGTDATDALLGIIAQEPDNATIDLGGARLHCEGTLALQGRHGLTIKNGTIYALDKGPLKTGFYNSSGTWVAYDPSDYRSVRSHWSFRDCTGITLDSLTVESTNTPDGSVPGFPTYSPSYAFEHGFRFEACDNITLVNWATRGTWGDCISIEAGPWVTPPDGSPKYRTPSSRIEVGPGRGDRAGRQGVSASWAHHLNLHDFTLTAIKRAAVDLETDGPTSAVTDVTIRRLNTKSGNPALAAKGQGNVSRVDVDDWVVAGSSAPVVSCDPPPAGMQRADWTIRRLRTTFAVGSPRYGIEIRNVSGGRVEDCDVQIKTGQGGRAVLLDTPGDYAVVGNRFTPAGTVITVTNPLPGTTQTVSGNTP